METLAGSPHAAAGPSPVSAPALPAGCGLMVVGHGTADPLGAGETHCLTAGVAAAVPMVPVALGFLEVIGPSIGDALAQLRAAGCHEVVAAPLLLFAAGHAKRDVPAAIAEAAGRLGLTVRQADPLGMHPAMVHLARERRRQAIAAAVDRPPAETVLVMVGRGSSDPSTPAQLEAFTRLSLAGEPPPARVLMGFVAAARPTVSEALATAAIEPGVRRVLVQPHLLFHGHVEEQVTAAVAEARRARPDIEWLQVERLGPDPLVAQAVVERAARCGFRADRADLV